MGRIGKRLLVATAASLLALSGAELAFRRILTTASGATDFDSYRKRCIGEQLPIFEEDRSGELVDLVPGSRQGNRITINRQGFRGSPVLVPKPADGFRVCMIGGSGCFGTTSSSDATTIAARLEAVLRERAAVPAHVEVMNGGLPGATTAGAVTRFEKRLRPFDVDVVILYNLINDLLTSRRVALGVDPRATPLVKVDSAISRVLSHSALYLGVVSARTQREKERSLAEAVKRQSESGRSARGIAPGAREVSAAVARESGHVYDGTPATNLYLVPKHVAEFESELRRFRAVVKEAGAVPVFCTFALRFRGDETQEEYVANGPVTAFYMPDWPMARDAVAHMNDVIRRIAEETGSILCDVAAELPRRPELFPPKDTDHFTDEGCAEVARLIAAELARSGCLRGAALPR